MSLKEYKRKRNFRNTPEPRGKGISAPGQKFVIQKHAARRLHYDLRLELDGTLKSWAVPKGPSLDPSVKALAVHVEDHPLEYAAFEGVIPEGEYGGGTVMVWDRGTWEPEDDPRKQYRAGNLKFRLHGDKLHGAWTLVRMHGAAGEDGRNWLLIKKQDRSASKKTDIVAARPQSVLTGRAIDEIAADADTVWQSNRAVANSKKKQTATTSRPKPKRVALPRAQAASRLAKLPGAQQEKLPAKFKPQLASLAAEVPEGDDWLHELKFDGYRMLAFCDQGKVRLVTRNGNDWTKKFSAIAAELERLPLKATLLDGEIVSLNDEGLSDFQQLQNLLRRGNDRALVYYLFDAPFVEGFDLTHTPLVDRKSQLASLLAAYAPGNEGVLRYSDHIQGQGHDVLMHACRYAMEGVISKRADSTYQQFRSPSWLKNKCLKRQEFVIGGFTKPTGSRKGFGALLLGYYQDGKLQYAGRVGTGFTHDSLLQVHAELRRRKAKASPFENPPRGAQARGVTWVKPELAGEVEFTEWTNDGSLRHPSFQGLREDKLAQQIIRETPLKPAKLAKGEQMTVPKQPHSRRSSAPSSDRSKGDDVVAGVRITHPERVLYPEQGLTKLDLAEYYERVADWILPYVANRPLTMVRCPEGSAGQCFFQKHLTAYLPQQVRGVMIQEKNKRAEYVVIDDIAGLVALVQFSAMEFHPWGGTVDHLDKPDQIVFDLDPGPKVTWKRIVDAAREVRQRLLDHGLDSFVRTSGGKGLHVVVPLKAVVKWDAMKEFARTLAIELATEQPKEYVAVSTKAKRHGKIFVDYLRNARGATSVASYSTRARRGAPIATPVRWEELGRLQSASQYTVVNIQRRLARLKEDPWKGFFTCRQTLK